MRLGTKQFGIGVKSDDKLFTVDNFCFQATPWSKPCILFGTLAKHTQRHYIALLYSERSVQFLCRLDNIHLQG